MNDVVEHGREREPISPRSRVLIAVVGLVLAAVAGLSYVARHPSPVAATAAPTESPSASTPPPTPVRPATPTAPPIAPPVAPPTSPPPPDRVHGRLVTCPSFISSVSASQVARVSGMHRTGDTRTDSARILTFARGGDRMTMLITCASEQAAPPDAVLMPSDALARVTSTWRVFRSPDAWIELTTTSQRGLTAVRDIVVTNRDMSYLGKPPKRSS